MSDTNIWIDEQSVVAGAGALADLHDVILLTASEAETVLPLPDMEPSDPARIQSAGHATASDGETPGPKGSSFDFGMSADEDVLANYMGDIASFSTAASAPTTPDQPAVPTGNGIFVAYEAPPPFVGLEAVGVLPPS